MLGTCKVDRGEIDTEEGRRSVVVKLDSHSMDFVSLPSMQRPA